VANLRIMESPNGCSRSVSTTRDAVKAVRELWQKWGHSQLLARDQPTEPGGW
jgi:hypothetical protein